MPRFASQLQVRGGGLGPRLFHLGQERLDVVAGDQQLEVSVRAGRCRAKALASGAGPGIE